MMKPTLLLATSLCFGALAGCESAVLVNNDPGTDSSTPAMSDATGAADTASYRETSDTRASGATTQPAMTVETKNVTVEKQRDNH
jgi:hypothetical protein